MPSAPLNWKTSLRANSVPGGFVLSLAALVLFGLVRFCFATFGVRVFGPAYVGDVMGAIAPALLLATVGAAPLAVLISKYVPELKAQDQRDRAARVYTAMMFAGVTVLVAPGVILGVGLGFRCVAIAYFSLYVVYLLLKQSMYAFQRMHEYFIAEAVSSATFFVAFGAACASGATALATVSLLCPPFVFLLIASRQLRREMLWAGCGHELRSNLRQYGPFLFSTLINALAGVAGYQLVLTVGALLEVDKTTLGYIAVLLAALSPFGLVPSALGTVLFPELARRYGAEDTQGQTRLVANATAFLQLFSGLAFGCAAILGPAVVSLLKVPAETGYLELWVVSCAALYMSTVSSPSGIYLNATKYVQRNSAISVTFVVLAASAAVVTFRHDPTLAAAVTYGLAMVPPAWIRGFLARNLLAARGRELLLAHATSITVFVFTLLLPGRTMTTDALLVGALGAMHVPLGRSVANEAVSRLRGAGV